MHAGATAVAHENVYLGELETRNCKTKQNLN